MNFSPTRVDELGRALRNHQDASVDDPSGTPHRLAKLIAAKELDTPHRRATSRVGFILSAAALLTAFLCVVWFSEAKPLTYSMSDGAAGQVGASFKVAPSDQETLAFSDGTTVRLHESTQATVSETGPNGAQLLLTRGRASIAVTPRENADWKFRAGPFLVKVTGTQFDLDWDPNTGRFHVKMFEGSVLVSGPRARPPRTVVAGEEILLASAKKTPDPNSPEMEPAREDNEGAADLTPAKVTGTKATPDRQQSQGKRAQEAHSAETGNDAPVTWESLADEKRYADALQLATTAGLEQLLEQSRESELLRFADVARYAGNFHVAERAYRTVRERFVQTNSSAVAAFQLGRLAAPHTTATKWFEEYLQSQPQGPLAMEALGRILELHNANGNEQAARRTAGRYLASYPDGPYATLAKLLSHP